MLHGKWHTLGMVYSFFLIRMYVSFRQEVSKGGFPTSRVYLGIPRQKGVSFGKETQIVHRSNHVLSRPRGFPGRGNTLGIRHTDSYCVQLCTTTQCTVYNCTVYNYTVYCAWILSPGKGSWNLAPCRESFSWGRSGAAWQQDSALWRQ